jgi:hypothetical protein
MSTAFEDCRADEERVDLSVPVLDLRVTDAAEVRVERDVRPGMLLWIWYCFGVWCWAASGMTGVDVWLLFTSHPKREASAGNDARADRDTPLIATSGPSATKCRRHHGEM